MINMIAAIAENHVIGCRGKIPWHLPEDLKRFRKLTEGHAVLMGRKTWESIPEKFRPLPGRTNIVATHELAYQVPEGVIVVHNPLDAPLYLEDGQDLFVIGGASVYGAYLDTADRFYLTEVAAEVQGDAFFPPYDENLWKDVRPPVPGVVDAKNPLPYRFRELAHQF